MKIQCGPNHDIRTLDLVLPSVNKIGVLVSGGIDSAVLYYLLLKLKYEIDSQCDIHPIIILRKEGSRYFARPLIDRINAIFGHSNIAIRLGDTSLIESQQVWSATIQALNILNFKSIYIGVIENRQEHTVGFDAIPTPKIPQIIYPFVDLQKSHVIDLYHKLGIQQLLEYTHSCDQHEQIICGTCNGCRERAWGFAELAETDPRLLKTIK